jgi:hypothetical protein
MSIRLHPLGAMLCLTLSGCASFSLGWPGSSEPPPATPAMAAALPASIPAQDLVGRWGLAAYHKEDDRARTEAAARAQCRQPYNITRGPQGGVIMHLADQSQPTELSLKGGPDGKNYIGPGEDPAGGPRDREVVSFDGRVLITRFTDQEVAGRYGTSVYARCTAETAPRKAAKKPPAKT